MELMRNKRNKDRVKSGYTKIDNKIYKVGLSAGALAVYCFCRVLAEEFDPSLSFLSTHLKISRPTAIKYLKELESRNILKKYEQGGPGRFSKYEFVAPGDWV